MPFWLDIKRIWALAWPVTLVHLVTIGISVTDVAMVSRYSVQELAYLGVARFIYWLGVVIAADFLIGMNVFPAREDGAGRQKASGDIYRQGTLYALILGSSAMLLEFTLAEPLLAVFGYEEDMVSQGADYLYITAIGIPYYLWMTASFLFMQGISRPRPGMVIMVAILPINVGLNAIFIPGLFGLPAMGASGAALATILAQAVGAAAMFIYLRKMKDKARFGMESLSLFPLVKTWKAGRALRRFGIAPGLAAGMEFSGWLVLNQVSGKFGVEPVAAMQVLISLHAISFAAVMGVASAASVRVGNAIGRKDAPAVFRVVSRSMFLVVLVMLPFIGVYIFADEYALIPFKLGMDLAALASFIIAVWAPFLIFDGLQFVLLFSLRAAGDEKWASVLQITSFMGVMAGGGLLAAFVFEQGFIGLIYGIAMGMTCAALLLSVRFYLVLKHLPTKLQTQEA
ncbi:MAG: MATE family efflux transporter [Sphingomonadales bacterium]|jgi:MATE family multidrug resistance protein